MHRALYFTHLILLKCRFLSCHCYHPSSLLFSSVCAPPFVWLSHVLSVRASVTGLIWRIKPVFSACLLFMLCIFTENELVWKHRKRFNGIWLSFPSETRLRQKVAVCRYHCILLAIPSSLLWFVVENNIAKQTQLNAIYRWTERRKIWMMSTSNILWSTSVWIHGARAIRCSNHLHSVGDHCLHLKCENII